MKNVIYILLFVLISIDLAGQNDQGVITYERRTFWINISSSLPWMTQEEIDRDKLTWGNRQGKWAEEYTLDFTPSGYVYKEKESDENMGFSRRAGQFVLSRNFDDKTLLDQVTLANKDYVIEGDIPATKWKIHNEIREIRGFLCMKAETTDPVKGVPVYAWFTDQIPVSGGPEGYGGLPGMILALEINTNCVLIEAIKVNLDKEPDLSISKKPKGKKVDMNEFYTESRDIIKKSVEMKRNPFWFIRY